MVRRIVLLIIVSSAVLAAVAILCQPFTASARQASASVSCSKRCAMSAIGLVVDILPASQCSRGVGEDRAADGKALDDRRVGGGGEGRLPARPAALRGPSSTTPRHHGSLRLDHRVDRAQAAADRLRLELPPVRLDAERIELGQRARDRVVVERAVLAGDDLDQQFAADLARRLDRACAASADLLGLQLGRIVGMIEAQALDAVVDRPFDQLRADVLA